ncbi:glycosyltransferase [Cohnella sp. CFH 77786]|uniref:glycosyltransferase n=1 Tax=Cohnella sp. CFH 77786 TaxID=2662265 RepID=UPI001C60D9AD
MFRFPIIDWHYRWQRPQHLSTKWAEDGHRVFYFTMQTKTIKQEDATFSDIASAMEVNPLGNHIWSVTLCSHKPVDPYHSVISHPLDYQYMLWSIQALKSYFNIRQTLSVIDLPYWYQLVQHFDRTSNKILYDCMDDLSGFGGVSPKILELEDELAEKADAVTVTSRVLMHNRKKQNENVFYLPNACEYSFFSKAPDTLAPELALLQKPIIGFYGAISNWFDGNLINQLAERNPDWQFVLVGHYYRELVEAFDSRSNILLLGEKPYSDLPKYLYAFDVCLIPFKQNTLTTATNPVKAYEYLCSGKPVVSTKLPELEALSSHIYLAEGVREFESAILKGLHESGKEARLRQEFAASNTWDERYAELKAIVSAVLYPKVSVVIPVFNQWSLTEGCLKSLLNSSGQHHVEIIVVDNASTDGTRQALATLQHPAVQVVSLTTNRGYAGAVNIGCQLATGEYLVLLNNDTLVPQGWLDRLIRPLREQEEIGIVGPMSNQIGNEQKLDFFASGDTQAWNEKWLDLFYAVNKGSLRDTDRLAFFCVAMRREVFDRIGDLDSRFTVGMFEDDDYCERIAREGYRLVIAEDAFVYHHGSATFKSMNQEQWQQIFNRNKSHFEKKWNRSWKPYPWPENIFDTASNGREAAEIVRASGLRCSIVAGKPDWTESPAHWKKLVRTLLDEGHLVIVYATSFCNQAIQGFKRIGPHLYLTNESDWIATIKHSVPEVAWIEPQ